MVDNKKIMDLISISFMYVYSSHIFAQMEARQVTKMELELIKRNFLCDMAQLRWLGTLHIIENKTCKGRYQVEQIRINSEGRYKEEEARRYSEGIGKVEAMIRRGVLRN